MAKKKWTDEERRELIQKLEKDMEEKWQETLAKGPRKPSDKSFEEELEELSTHPAFAKEIDPTKPLHPAMEALQVLKYESEDAEDNAESYKEDGNYNFKNKKYKWAIDSYTKGLTEKCVNKELNAILYCNRAAAHWHIGNYRSSFYDTVFALKFKPDHMKAIIRGVMCCLEIKRFEEAIQWCDNGLYINADEKTLLQLRAKAVAGKAQLEKEKRKEQLKERRQEAEEAKLVSLIQSRGVKLSGRGKKSSILESIETQNPSNTKVFVGEDGALHWPVMFLYPEYGETDFIQDFNENHSLSDHIETMFGDTSEPAPWDTELKYKPQNIEVYFEDRDNTKLIRLKQSSTLCDILQHDRYIVHGGTPGFIILVKDSEFAKTFCSQYS